MENNLHNANEELASLLGQQPTNKSQSNTINTENKALSPKNHINFFKNRQYML